MYCKYLGTVNRQETTTTENTDNTEHKHNATSDRTVRLDIQIVVNLISHNFTTDFFGYSPAGCRR